MPGDGEQNTFDTSIRYPTPVTKHQKKKKNGIQTAAVVCWVEEPIKKQNMVKHKYKS